MTISVLQNKPGSTGGSWTPPWAGYTGRRVLGAKGRVCGGREVASGLKEMKYYMQRAY